MKRREILSEATSKTLFGIVFDLSDRVRLGKRLCPLCAITGNGLVPPAINKGEKINKRKVDSWERTCNNVVGFVIW